MESAVFYNKGLPSRGLFPDESVLFYDSILAKTPAFRSWGAKFRYKIPLRAGEKLKSLKSLETLLHKLTDLGVPHTTKLTFVAVGGGSVGDAVGFLASIYMRGRPLVMIPSTWLAAIDSAHGGKNGLNFAGKKNQLGTFYLPEAVFICSDLLKGQPKERAFEAMGEIIKMGVIAGGALYRRVESLPHQPQAEHILGVLKACIKQKYRVVSKDPRETSGHRRILNLGHTVGHVLEAKFGMAHGHAVLLGLQFALRWSVHRGFLSETEFFKLSLLLENHLSVKELNNYLGRLSQNDLKSLLSKDKKTTAKNTIDFIFVRSAGSCTREKVFVSEVIHEVARQVRNY